MLRLLQKNTFPSLFAHVWATKSIAPCHQKNHPMSPYVLQALCLPRKIKSLLTNHVMKLTKCCTLHENNILDILGCTLDVFSIWAHHNCFVRDFQKCTSQHLVFRLFLEIKVSTMRQLFRALLKRPMRCFRLSPSPSSPFATFLLNYLQHFRRFLSYWCNHILLIMCAWPLVPLSHVSEVASLTFFDP